MRKKNVVILVTILLFAVVVVGEALTYVVVPRYDASVTDNGDSLSYKVSTNSAVDYTAVAFDNARPVDNLYIYYDEEYAVLGTTHTDQHRFIIDLVVELRTRGVTNVEIVNAEKLGEIVNSPHMKGDAILVNSGSLPDTVYSLTNNGIFDWVDAGGSLYWIGYRIGSRFSEGNEIKNAKGSYQTDIFETICIYPTGSQAWAYERSSGEGEKLGAALKITPNLVNNGLNVEAIRSVGREAISLGFELDGYSSVSLVEKGDGMICVMGQQEHRARMSIAQIISSGVSYSSKLLTEPVSGSVVRGSSAGTIDASGWGTAENIAVHIWMGEPYIVYARTEFFRRS